DGEYVDGRHPESVQYTSSLTEDLRRRDFTINAMAYSDETGLVDMFDGREDLKRGIIRCVGQAHERFTEDALRMMRAVRFSAQLGFSLEENTAQAIKELSETITKISHERVRDELTKLLISDNPGHVTMLYELGLTRYIFPEFDDMMACEQNTKYHCYSVGVHTVKVVEGVPANVDMRYAALLHDVGKIYSKKTVDGVDHFWGHAAISEERARVFLRDMRFDNETIRRVCILVKYHDSRIEPTPRAMRRLINRVGMENMDDLFDIMYADLAAKSEYSQRFKSSIDNLKSIYEEVRDQNDCVSIKNLAVNGGDLIGIGIPAGRHLGEVLNALLEVVMEDPSQNEKDKLLELAKNM
ncbi:MAG: HDIG domain-containing protein, partial [Lachnospiraceae bacterium]|nr:HDIG domain-containing protein [Lachnospiraceae bacterium]